MNGEKSLEIFCRYAENGASSRLRFYKYLPFFEKNGIKTAIHPFFDAAYLERLYAGKGRTLSAIPKGIWRRRGELSRIPREVPLFIEYELFPMLWSPCDLAALKNRPFYLNFDDPVWEKYAKIPFLKHKYDTLVRHASGVIVANDLLMERFSKLNPNILKVPTAVDLDHYISAAQNKEKFSRFTLVWIGSPATYHYLKSFQPVLKKMAEVCDFELLIIGKSAWGPLPGVPSRSVEWSEETEAELLARSHAGIMPLPDESFAKGKSAYKLIQYAAAGIPSLGSPVGENNHVIRHGETGFLCASPQEWCNALKKLCADAVLRKNMGAAAHSLAADWSISKHASRVADFIFRC